MKYSSGLIIFGMFIAGVIYAIHCRTRYGDSAKNFPGLILEFVVISTLGFGIAWLIAKFSHSLGKLIG